MTQHTGDMRMGGYTRGPWRVASGCDQYIRSEGTWIASTMGMRGEEGAANARLIAASPEAHAANILTVDSLATEYSIPDDADDEYIYDTLGSALSSAYFAARAAIARATGATTPANPKDMERG